MTSFLNYAYTRLNDYCILLIKIRDDSKEVIYKMTEVLYGTILSAMSTGLGALIILFIGQSMTHKWRDILLAFTAGIMMAASTMSLIPEALNAGGFLPLVVGIFLGVLTLTLLEKTFHILTSLITKKGLNLMKKRC